MCLNRSYEYVSQSWLGADPGMFYV